MNVLISPWVKWLALVAAIVAAVLIWNWRYSSGYSAGQNEGIAQQQQADKEALAAANDRYRQQEQQLNAKLSSLAQQHAEELARANASRDAAQRSADAFGVRLNEVTGILRKSAASAGADPVAAGTSARNTAILLAELLRKSVERNRQLAAFADESRVAGLLCEGSYDAVQATTNTVR